MFCSHELLMFTLLSFKALQSNPKWPWGVLQSNNGKTEKELYAGGIIKQHHNFDQIPLGQHALLHKY